MNIKLSKIKTIKPYENNPRKNDQAVEAVAKSIQEFGFLQPIVVDEKGVIIVGHTRYKAAVKLGLEEAPVVVAKGLSAAQVKAYRIADNQTNNLSEWDYDLLPKELRELVEMDYEVDVLGFEKDVLAEIMGNNNEGLTEEDEVAECPKEATNKRGDLWGLGRHRLLCGDSTKKGDVEKLMEGLLADMVFMDPPYSVNYGADQDTLNKKSRGKFRKVAAPIKGDNMTVKDCSEKLWRPAFRNLYDVAKDTCSFYMTMCQGGDQMMMMSEKWNIKHELIWVKSSPVFSMGRLNYDYKHEPILFGWKKTHKFYGKGHFLNSVWEIAKPHKSELHPTMKPIALIENALLNSSCPNEICVDLFLGSGSTIIACEKTNRVCYGMEIDEKYCDVIIKRWEEYTGKKAVKLK